MRLYVRVNVTTHLKDEAGPPLNEVPESEAAGELKRRQDVAMPVSFQLSSLFEPATKMTVEQVRSVLRLALADLGGTPFGEGSNGSVK